ncbi:Hypothetical predicted protein [Drosophila guanche]|uniref:Uncharacterized protein n=1 Tax=Drosophila guanche TaxID=7266 RepID=A0A3B0KTC0_DROGU|nr:Hypothetical predicted protein [Drosophila guanche]
MSGGMQESTQTALKAAITAAITAAIGNVNGGDSSSGIVDELKQVIVNDNSSGSGSGSGSAILQQESTGTDSSSSGGGNSNVRNEGSEGRLTICNVIFGDDNQTSGHSNNNSNGNGNSNASSGIFYRIIRRVDRLLRRWLPGYNYLRGGSGSGSGSGSAELSMGTGGNAPEYVTYVDASNAAELQWINEQQQQELAEVRVQGSSSTMTGHRNKWLTNEYLSGGITRAEFSAHLENILQKRMHKDNEKQVASRGKWQHQN